MATQVLRWAGPAAVLGGLLWVVHAIMVARLPEGCIGAECAVRPMRDSGSVAPLALGALLFLGLGLAGLMLRARRASRFGRLGRSGLVAAAIGVVALVLAGLVQAIAFRGDFPLMPVVVIPAGLAVVVGFVLVGVAILRAGILPRWVAALLILCTLVLLGVNDQNAQILLAIPFGLAWIVIGLVLWQGDRRAPASDLDSAPPQAAGGATG